MNLEEKLRNAWRNLEVAGNLNSVRLRRNQNPVPDRIFREIRGPLFNRISLGLESIETNQDNIDSGSLENLSFLAVLLGALRVQSE